MRTLWSAGGRSLLRSSMGLPPLALPPTPPPLPHSHAHQGCTAPLDACATSRLSSSLNPTALPASSACFQDRMLGSPLPMMISSMMATCCGLAGSYAGVDTHSYVMNTEPGLSTRYTSPYTCAASAGGRASSGVDGGGLAANAARRRDLLSCSPDAGAEGQRRTCSSVGAWHVASIAYAPSNVAASNGMSKKLPRTALHCAARPCCTIGGGRGGGERGTRRARAPHALLTRHAR